MPGVMISSTSRRIDSNGSPACGGGCGGVEAERRREAATAPDGRLGKAAALFKALSDETRLRIVRTMAQSQSELCECNIVPLFGLSQSTISYHLKVLRGAGIGEGER